MLFLNSLTIIVKPRLLLLCQLKHLLVHLPFDHLRRIIAAGATSIIILDYSSSHKPRLKGKPRAMRDAAKVFSDASSLTTTGQPLTFYAKVIIVRTNYSTSERCSGNRIR